MALDGFVMANMAHELSHALTGGKIAKISQPEPDELLLTIKNAGISYRLLISAGASLPLIYLTDQNKPAPATAPTFCMVLRKHIGNARILSLTQPSLERILIFELEHLDEMGDLCRKRLIVELMGKHSNLIFTQEDGTIIDSIKHIPASVSSVREVLPGRPYFIPDTQRKLDPLTVSQEDFLSCLASSNASLHKTLYGRLTGFSPIVSEELCVRASLDSDISASSLTQNEGLHLYHMFTLFMEEVRQGQFAPTIYLKDGVAEEFSALPLHCLSSYEGRTYSSISEVLSTYYTSRNDTVRIRQKSAELRRVVQTALERSSKKFDLQGRQLRDTEKREKYRLYGELLNTYGYGWDGESSSYCVINYYDGRELAIPMDTTLSFRENANRHFARYNKLKRTHEALSGHILETEAELAHLESIATALDLATSEEDLGDIKEELREYGYIHKRGPKDKKNSKKSRPLLFETTDGFLLYVGKNNYQNEELTFKRASGGDWWFHAKGIPGSHVIVKCEGRPLPDHVFEEAAALAAYYSRGRDNDKVEVDYVEKKHIKKVAGAAPGFVIYHTNYSMTVTPGLWGLTEKSQS